MSTSSGVGYPMIDHDASNLFEIPNPTGTPERRLLLAILERAILDYVGNDQREMEEAEEWLFSERDTPRNEAFSFPWVCHELDLDVGHIAEQIRLMPKRGSSRIAPWYIRDAQKAAGTVLEESALISEATVNNGDHSASDAKRTGQFRPDQFKKAVPSAKSRRVSGGMLPDKRSATRTHDLKLCVNG